MVQIITATADSFILKPMFSIKLTYLLISNSKFRVLVTLKLV